jgi:uncharacterized protein
VVDSGILGNLLDPAILFFVLGVGVAAVRSNLEIPPQVVKFLSLYLLMAIGFKGGRALSETGFDGELGRVVLAAVALAVAIPAASFVVLRLRIDRFDAAAIAATYGSVSAVTFIAASSFLQRQGIDFSGAMTVALVVMESPAIIMAVFLAAWARSHRSGRPDPLPVAAGLPGASSLGAAVATGPALAEPEAEPVPFAGLGHVLREAFTDGAHLLLIGAMVVGAFSTEAGAEAMAPFTTGLFKGILALFLLEMGMLVCRELRELRNVGPFLVGFGVAAPLVNAGAAIAAAAVFGLSAGNAVLLAVLAASGSYIVAPAVIRYAIPEAKPSRYFGLALGVTFPFNIVVGIPLYHAIVTAVW